MWVLACVACFTGFFASALAAGFCAVFAVVGFAGAAFVVVVAVGAVFVGGVVVVAATANHGVNVSRAACRTTPRARRVLNGFTSSVVVRFTDMCS